MPFIWSMCVQCRERQDYQVHYLFHGTAEEQAADDPMFLHERQLAAEGVVDCCSRAGNKEMQDHSECVRASTAVDCLPTQETRRNHARNSPTKQNAGLQQIQRASAEATNQDWQQRTAFLRGQCS